MQYSYSYSPNFPNSFDKCWYEIIDGKRNEISSNNPNYTIIDNVLYSKDMKTLIGFPAETDITKYVVPECVETIEPEAFYNCMKNSATKFSKLTSIEVHPDNQYYTSVDGVLFSKDMETLISFPPRKNIDNYVVPEGVITIAEGAFYSSSIKGITLSSTVKEIKNDAMSHCRFLNELIMNEGLEKIGDNALSSTNIEIFDCPLSLKEMGNDVLSGTTFLKEVNINANITEFNAEMLRFSIALEAINVSPDNPYFTSVDGELFSKDMKTLVAFPHEKEDVDNYAVPEGVVTVAEGAFNNCNNLLSITISSTCTEIEGNTLGKLYNLNSIEVHPDNPNFTSVDGVLYSKDMKTLIAFPCDKDITNYVVPEGVTKIESDAFNKFVKLESITLPSTLQIVEKDTFKNLTNLKTITIPPHLEEWTKLESTTLPFTLPTVEKDTFKNLTNLRPITLLSHLEEWTKNEYEFEYKFNEKVKINITEKDINNAIEKIINNIESGNVDANINIPQCLKSNEIVCNAIMQYLNENPTKLNNINSLNLFILDRDEERFWDYLYANNIVKNFQKQEFDIFGKESHGNTTLIVEGNGTPDIQDMCFRKDYPDAQIIFFQDSVTNLNSFSKDLLKDTHSTIIVCSDELLHSNLQTELANNSFYTLCLNYNEFQEFLDNYENLKTNYIYELYLTAKLNVTETEKAEAMLKASSENRDAFLLEILSNPKMYPSYSGKFDDLFNYYINNKYSNEYFEVFKNDYGVAISNLKEGAENSPTIVFPERLDWVGYMDIQKAETLIFNENTTCFKLYPDVTMNPQIIVCNPELEDFLKSTYLAGSLENTKFMTRQEYELYSKHIENSVKTIIDNIESGKTNITENVSEKLLQNEDVNKAIIKYCEENPEKLNHINEELKNLTDDMKKDMEKQIPKDGGISLE